MKRLLSGTVAVCLYLGATTPARCEYIYWSDFYGGDLRRANLDGNGQTILVTGQSNPVGPALDLVNGWMYWGQGGGSTIQRANLDGSGKINVVTNLSGPAAPALDLAGGRMYWNNSSGGTIQSANLDGTGRTTLATGQSDPHSVRLDLAGKHLYWPDFGAGSIRRVNLDGTGLTTLVTGLALPGVLALDVSGGKMYWTNQGPDDIRRANLDGSGQEILLSNQDNPAAMTLDVVGGKMYWTNIASGEIRRANLDGTGQQTLFTGLPGPGFIALDLVSDSAPRYTWNTDTNGNWWAASNWTIGVPYGVGVEVVLGGVITSPRTVTVDQSITVGRLNFDNTTAYTIAGTGLLTLDSTSGDAQINVAGGRHTISAVLRVMDNTTITTTPVASSLAITSPTSFVGKTVTKAGAGTLTLNNIRAAGLSINDGTVAIAPNGTAFGTSMVGLLSIAGDDTPTAKLDLANNAAIINYPAAGPNPEMTIRAQIIAGRGGSGLGKTWNGLGITSSQAAADPVNAGSVGYADNAALPLGAKSTFGGGLPVDHSAVLIRYTRTGDANLDGVVNNDDVTIVGANYAPGFAKPYWALGDFDYNGFVDNDDVTLLGVYYNPNATPIPAPGLASDAAATVPEPATLVLFAAGLLLIRAYHTARRKQRIP